MIQGVTVENINGSGCIHAIKSALMKISGVEMITIDQEMEIVTIYGLVERKKLINALSKLGYPEKGKNDFLQKTKSFVSCMIGKNKLK